MKKLFGLFVSFALCFTLVGGISAATPNETVLNALKNAGIPTEYYNQAETYLKSNTITEAQAGVIVTNVDSAVAVLKAEGITEVSKITATVFDKIKGNIEAAAAELGLSVSVDYKNKSVVLKDADGKVVFEATKVIKNTGDDFTSTLTLVGVMAILLAGAGLVASKKKLFVR